MLLLSDNFHGRILARTNLKAPTSFATRARRATEPSPGYFEAVGPPGQHGTS